MINRNTAGNRFVETVNGVVRPVESHPIKINETKPEDYPGLAQVYFEVADMWGPRFGGPPLCDEWVAVLKHILTEEEASAIRHMKGARKGKTAQDIAEAEHRPVEDIRRIMDVLTDEKVILNSFDRGENRRYFLQPMFPGVWETILVRTSKDSLTDWHRKFADLFIPLYNTGFTGVHAGKRPPGIRYLPVNQSIESIPMALPADKLGEIFDSYDYFSVGLCMCRLAGEIIGESCGRPLDNCILMGPQARHWVERGGHREINIKEALEIKVEAEASGLVSWTGNFEIGESGSSCSCCGCCCLMMRTISQFSKPGFIAPPHFMPAVDSTKCSSCGKCANACPMGALTVDTEVKTHSFESVRCIGCGLCLAACDKEKAIELKPVPGYEAPVLKKIKLEDASHPLAGISGIKEK